MTMHPTVLWAQRSDESDESKNVVFLTIQVQDPINVKIDLDSQSLKFNAESPNGDTKYELNLEFYDEIDPEKSRRRDAGNSITFVLQKKNAQSEFWPRLLKEKLKLHYIKTDFDKWVDEDEQDEIVEEDDTANMMGGAGGMPGMGDMASMMGGQGGAGNFDFSQLLGNAGANGDLSSLASQLGENGANDDEPENEDAENEDAEEKN